MNGRRWEHRHRWSLDLTHTRHGWVINGSCTRCSEPIVVPVPARLLTRPRASHDRRITVNIGHYAKSITYIALTAVTFLVTAIVGGLTVDEIINLVVLVLGAILIYLVPNLPSGPARIAKTGVAFAVAGLVTLLSFLSDGVTPSEWLQIVLAAFAGVGVFIVPNEPPATFAELGSIEYVPGETLRSDRADD